jgi:hypothetical protein
MTEIEQELYQIEARANAAQHKEHGSACKYRQAVSDSAADVPKLVKVARRQRQFIKYAANFVPGSDWLDICEADIAAILKEGNNE